MQRDFAAIEPGGGERRVVQVAQQASLLVDEGDQFSPGPSDRRPISLSPVERRGWR